MYLQCLCKLYDVDNGHVTSSQTMMTLDLSWEADFDAFFSCKTTSCSTQLETVSELGTFDDMKANIAKQQRVEAPNANSPLLTC